MTMQLNDGTAGYNGYTGGGSPSVPNDPVIPVTSAYIKPSVLTLQQTLQAKYNTYNWVIIEPYSNFAFNASNDGKKTVYQFQFKTDPKGYVYITSKVDITERYNNPNLGTTGGDYNPIPIGNTIPPVPFSSKEVLELSLENKYGMKWKVNSIYNNPPSFQASCVSTNRGYGGVIYFTYDINSGQPTAKRYMAVNSSWIDCTDSWIFSNVVKKSPINNDTQSNTETNNIMLPLIIMGIILIIVRS